MAITTPTVSMSITTSFVSRIIVDLSTRFEQTHEMKQRINNSITNTGHGSIFLGTSARLEGGERNIRMLVGAHFARHGTFKIGTFGGKCNRDEITINTVIRETIEEVFNIPVDDRMVDAIRYYLNTNTNLYYISQISTRSIAFSYIFDVSVLGEFIRIIKQENAAFFIPTNDGLSNISLYLQSNIQFSDMSSFNEDRPSFGNGTTINLVKFLRDRNISHKMQETYKRLNFHKSSGQDEVKYLSFVSLFKLVEAAPSGKYQLYNFNKHRRENLYMQSFLASLMDKDIIRFILSYQ
jgi:hypothetical protein